MDSAKFNVAKQTNRDSKGKQPKIWKLNSQSTKAQWSKVIKVDYVRKTPRLIMQSTKNDNAKYKTQRCMKLRTAHCGADRCGRQGGRRPVRHSDCQAFCKTPCSATSSKKKNLAASAAQLAIIDFWHDPPHSILTTLQIDIWYLF